jgi:hypothetical protein
MELTSEQWAVLQVFKELDVGQGEHLASHTFAREMAKLPDEIQDDWMLILRSLVHSHHVSFHPLGYGLTKKGHQALYSNSDG